MFKNKEGKVRSGWKIAAIMGVFLGITMLLSIIVGIVVSGILISNGDLSIQTGEYTKRGEELITNLNVVMTFFQEIIMIIIPIIAWKRIMKRSLSSMGLTPLKPHLKEFIVGLTFGIISISIVFGALIVTKNAEIVSLTPHFAPSQLLYLCIFILVGFAEEILGRGYVMSVLRQTKSIPIVVIVSSLVFAFLHSMNPGIGFLPYVNLTLVGILFAYMYLKSGNLWMCIGYHITWNYFQGYIYGFKVSGSDSEGIITTVFKNNTIFNGGDFGPEGGLIVTVIILAGLVFVRFFYKDNNFDFMSLESVEITQEESEVDETNNETL